MAKQTVSEEEIQLRKRARRRLVGAIALTILAAIFLPMVFDDQVKPVGNVQIQIPDEKTVSPFQQGIQPASAPAAVP
ncbi:MAG: SPOR domain-containing protein, partial [Burkholderiales bacterium]